MNCFHRFQKSNFSRIVVVVVGSLYWARSRLQPSTFRILFPTYLESVPPGSMRHLDNVRSVRGVVHVVSISTIRPSDWSVSFVCLYYLHRWQHEYQLLRALRQLDHRLQELQTPHLRLSTIQNRRKNINLCLKLQKVATHFEDFRTTTATAVVSLKRAHGRFSPRVTSRKESSIR